MTDLNENEMKNLLLETFYFRTTVKKIVIPQRSKKKKI